MKVGFIGWRGMVGSVLMQRMREENDFANIPEAYFFTTSNVGGAAPDFGQSAKTLLDANNIAELAKMDTIVTCQGGDYTKSVYEPLRAGGWNGYWIDAASTLRMKEDAIIVLDPVNRSVIDAGLKNGIKNYIRFPDANVAGRAVPKQPGGMGNLHDLSGSIRRRRKKYARTHHRHGRNPQPSCRRTCRPRRRNFEHRPKSVRLSPQRSLS